MAQPVGANNYSPGGFARPGWVIRESPVWIPAFAGMTEVQSLPATVIFPINIEPT